MRQKAAGPKADSNSTALTESAVIYEEIKKLRKRLESMEKLLKGAVDTGAEKQELVDTT